MVLYPLPCSRRSSYPKKIDQRKLMFVCDVYFNFLMKIIEETTFQINSFTFIL